MASLDTEDTDAVMTKVKTELLDGDEDRSAAAAAAAAAAENSDNSDNISEDDQLSADDAALNTAAGEYSIKHEKKTEVILDLSRIAADADDSASGIR